MLTFPRNLTEAEDAVFYVDHIDEAMPLWHGNHLVFEPAMHLLVVLVQQFWHGATALVVMQLANLAAALLSLALVALIARRAGVGPWGASAAVWLLGGCFAFWLYGMYPETYVLPIPLVLGHVLAMRELCWNAGGPRLAVLAGVLAAAATLLHQSHVFLVLPGLVAMIVTGRAALIPLWLGVTGTLVAAAYLWVGFGLLDQTSLGQFLDWARGYAADGLWTPFSMLSPVKALVGLGTAIWSSLFLFAAPDLDGMIQTMFPDRSFLEERYFADTGLFFDHRLLGLLTVASIAAIATLALRALWRGGPQPANGYLPLLGLHAVTYAAITTIWEPANKEFWIAALPLLVLLVVLRLDPAPRWLRNTALTGIGTLWLVNGAGAMMGFARAETDYWRVMHAGLLEQVRAGDVVVDDCSYMCTGYVLLLSPGELLDTGSLDRATETGPGRILLTSRAVTALDASPPEGWTGRRAALVPVIASGGLAVYELSRPLATPSKASVEGGKPPISNMHQSRNQPLN